MVRVRSGTTYVNTGVRTNKGVRVRVTKHAAVEHLLQKSVDRG